MLYTTSSSHGLNAQRPARQSERGQIIVIAALCIVATVALAGAAVDVGYARFEKRRMQTAADSAAVAGAYALKTGADYTSAAQSDSSLNGFTNGSNGITVTVNNPPSAGAYSGNTNYVEATVSQSQPTWMLRTVGISSIPAAARAVAYIGSNTSCVFGLDTSGSAISASGSVSITSQCGMLSDSNMTVTGSASLQAPSFNVAGTYSGPAPPQVSPAPVSGDLPVSDPLSYLTAPATGSCTQTRYHLSGGKTDTLSPGTYCGGIQVDSGCTVSLLPGTYVINGGGLAINSGAIFKSVNADGTTGGGVTFYNTYSASYSYSSISINGSATVTLTAPSSGTYAGILFFTDRSVTSTQTNTINGNSSSSFSGTMYFPSTPLSYGGSGTTAAYTILVAKDVSFSGGATLNNTYTSLPNGLSPIKTEGVAE